MTCTLCNSKKHTKDNCFMGKLPKQTLEVWEKGKNYHIQYWHKQKIAPTIEVKEISRLISLARKNLIHDSLSGEERIVIEACFEEIRRVLELRRRGRK